MGVVMWLVVMGFGVDWNWIFAVLRGNARENK